MVKCYTIISTVPGVAKVVERKFMYEFYDDVESVVDKTKWIPESQVLSSASMQPSPAVYDGDPSLDAPMPLSRQRGLDPAVVSTSVRERQKRMQSKVEAHNAKVAAEQKAQQQLDAINNVSE